MAGNVNKVFLMGNLTRDVEMRSLPSGMNVGNFGIAVNERFKSKDGEWQERVNFIDCEVWGRTAEIMSQYLKKGRPAFIEGRLRLDQWEDKQGQKRSKLKVVVDNFQFVDSRTDGGGGGGGGSSGGGSGQSQVSVPDDSPAIDHDDIPF